MNLEQKLNNLKEQKRFVLQNDVKKGVKNEAKNKIDGQDFSSSSPVNLKNIQFKHQFHKQKKPILKAGFYRYVFVLVFVFIALSSVLIYNIKNLKKESASANITLKNVVEKVNSEEFDNLFGGPESLATKSRLNKETTQPSDWLKRNFAVREGVLDQDFKCLQESICGDLADPDNDGVINLLEYNFGLDPNSKDVDNDGLGDGDELFVYFTNPRNSDSDNDGEKDFSELITCTDPTIDIKKQIFAKDALNKITNNIVLKPLHEPTITSFRLNGATVSDIQNFGYFKQKCDIIKEEAKRVETQILEKK